MINLANIYEFWIFPPFLPFDCFVRFVHIVVSLINFFLPIIKKKILDFTIYVAWNCVCFQMSILGNESDWVLEDAKVCLIEVSVLVGMSTMSIETFDKLCCEEVKNSKLIFCCLWMWSCLISLALACLLCIRPICTWHGRSCILKMWFLDVVCLNCMF